MKKLIDRLKDHSIKKDNGCHIWRGYTTKAGYGLMTIRNPKRHISVHRAAYIECKGPIPDGMFILHSCDVKTCINPDHLFVGTQKENVADCISKKRRVNVNGEKHGLAKLTEDQVIAIRNDVRPQKTIGIQYGIAQPQVSRIKNGVKWRYL